MARRRRRTASKGLALVLLVLCTVALIFYITRGGGAQKSNSTDYGVVLNEVMTSNKGAVADEYGDFPDWAEIHNTTDKALDVSGYGLTDDLLSAAKWTFPSGTVIEPNGYLVVFCSGDASVGGLHAGFKLSASDDLILSTVSGSVIVSI